MTNVYWGVKWSEGMQTWWFKPSKAGGVDGWWQRCLASPSGPLKLNRAVQLCTIFVCAVLNMIRIQTVALVIQPKREGALKPGHIGPIISNDISAKTVQSCFIISIYSWGFLCMPAGCRNYNIFHCWLVWPKTYYFLSTPNHEPSHGSQTNFWCSSTEPRGYHRL